MCDKYTLKSINEILTSHTECKGIFDYLGSKFLITTKVMQGGELVVRRKAL